jgi:hypothetical protein
MANLGKFFLLVLVQLFIVKAVFASALPIFKADQQVVLVEESQENEASDDSYELKFLDEYIDFAKHYALYNDANLLPLKKAYSFHNPLLIIGYKNDAFRPPCAQ